MKKLVSLVVCFVYVVSLSPLPLMAGGFSRGEKVYVEARESVVIKASEGGVVELGDARIEIPVGALAEDTEISISRLGKVVQVDEGLYNVTEGRGYRFEPAGTKFLEDVTIELPYTKLLSANETSLEKIHSYYYDTKKKQWKSLKTKEVDRERNVVVSYTDHFTDMINATLSLPETPDLLDSNINSIKNLQVANPFEGVIEIEGLSENASGEREFINQQLSGNAFGDANFTMTLPVPTGMNDLSPEITLAYSSGAGNGIMGKGFDIEYGSTIITDTLFGLPEYKGKDTYMKDGVYLEVDNINDNGEGTYILSSDTSYDKITRVRSDGLDYWEVIEKSGIKKTYGKKNDDANAGWGGVNKTQKYLWYLETVEDTDGNVIYYDYVKDSGYVYINKITYGNYSIQFEYVKDAGEDARLDVQVDGRGKYISECKWRLKSVTTQHKDAQIKKFGFTYGSGLANISLLEKFSVYGTDNTEHYNYGFTYNELEKSADGKDMYFGNPIQWKDEAKPLYATSETSLGGTVSGAAGVGIGTYWLDVRVSVGGQGAWSSGESYSEFTLVDINGDGRDDSVKKEGNNLIVYFNDGETGFTNEQSIPLEDTKKIDFTESSSSAGGVSVYVGVGSTHHSLAIGYTFSEVWQYDDSKILQAFIDVDGDGFTDILESGKTSYFKNLGWDEENNKPKGFEKTFFQSTRSAMPISIPEPVLSDDRKKAYEDSFALQTPFRGFKIPHDGTIEIDQSVSYVNAATVSRDGIWAKTYFKTADPIVSLEVGSDAKTNIHTLEVKAGDYIYFVSDSIVDSRGDDIDWNIKIRYTKYPAFVPKYFAPEVYEAEKLPTVYTPTQIGDIQQYLKGEVYPLDDPKFQRKPFEEVTAKLVYDATLDLYRFIDTNNVSAFLNYIPSLVRTDALNNNYTVNDIRPEWSGTPATALYKKDGSESGTTNDTREKLQQGSAYDDASIIYLGTYEDKPLHITKKNSSTEYDVYIDNVKAPEYTGTINKSLGGTSRTVVITSDKQTLTYALSGYSTDTPATITKAEYERIRRDEQKKEKMTITEWMESSYEDSDFTNFFDPLAASASFSIDDFKEAAFVKTTKTTTQRSTSTRSTTVNEPTVTTTIVDITTDNSVKTTKTITNTTSESTTEIASGSTKTKTKTVTVTNDETVIETKTAGATTTTTTTGQKITVTTEPGPEPEPELPTTTTTTTTTTTMNNDGTVTTTVTEISTGTSPNTKTTTVTENRTLDGDLLKPQIPDLDGTTYTKKTTLTATDTSTANAILTKWQLYNFTNNQFPYYTNVNNDDWYEYMAVMLAPRNALDLSTIASEYNLGLYKKIEKSIAYKNDYAYTVNNTDGKTTYQLTTIDSDDNIVAEDIDVRTWDSSVGWDVNAPKENFAKPYIFYEYEQLVEVPEGVESIGETEIIPIMIPTEDFLYGGGEESWYYGIWLGKQSENPFSEEALTATTTKAREMTEKEAQEEKEAAEQQQKDIKEGNVPEIDDTEKQVFYVPNLNGYTDSNTALLYIEKDEENGGVSLDSAALVGSITTNSTLLSTSSEGDRTYKEEQFAPFMQGDHIHTNRAGGLEYYEIPGLFVDHMKRAASLRAGFSIPSISMTDSEGNDVSHAGSAEFPLATGSIASSTNESTGKMIQSIEDINGDEVPDILVSNGNTIEVTLGKNTNSNISYNTRYTMANAGALASTDSVIDIIGGGLGPQGSVEVNKNTTGSPTEISFGGSLGGSWADGTDEQTIGLLDINGDGLPDYISNRSIALNTGDKFSPTPFSIPAPISKGHIDSVGYSIEVGFGIGGKKVQAKTTKFFSAGIGAGISASTSIAVVDQQFMDINGDDLPDNVYKKDDSFFVAYNRGNSFADAVELPIPKWNITDAMKNGFKDNTDGNVFATASLPLIGDLVGDDLNSTSSYHTYADDLVNLTNTLGFSSTTSIGIGGSLAVEGTIKIWIPFTILFVNITGSVGGGVSGDASLTGTTVTMADITGDGLVDHILRIPGPAASGGGLWVKKNLTGQAGLLKSIDLPQGGEYTISYDYQTGTPNMPSSMYVMSQVVLKEAGDAEGNITKFTYEDGFYDRIFKDFYGFGKVTIEYGEKPTDGNSGEVKNITYSKNITEYYNDFYYRKGLPRRVEEIGLDAWTGAEITYRTQETVMQEVPNAQPKSVTTQTSSINGKPIETVVNYEYDNEGNVTKIETTIDNKIFKIETFRYTDGGLDGFPHAFPDQIEVYGPNNVLLKKQGAVYDDGSMVTLKEYWNKTQSLDTQLDYHNPGLLASTTDANGTISYKYDADGYIISIEQGPTDAAGYKSAMTWDPVLGVKTTETDIAGNKMNYAYDVHGRIKTITSKSIPGISYDYVTPARKNGIVDSWYAMTTSKVSFDQADTRAIRAIVEIDGLGRITRSAKDGEIYNRDEDQKIKGWNVKRDVVYDAQGRSITEYMGYFVAGTDVANFLESTGLANPKTQKKYDYLNRVVEITLPDGKAQTNKYSITDDGINLTETTDYEGNLSRQYKDSNGNILKVERLKGDEVLTSASYVYNGMGAMLHAYPTKDTLYPVSMTYDLLGRRLSISSIDSGTKTYTYDDGGGLTHETNSKLGARSIAYEYDDFDRVSKIDYPFMTDTVYTYGALGATDNSAGKITKVEDETGSIEYEYGTLGEITAETRTINHISGSINAESETATIEYESDYMGRMQKITYPDGEVLAYDYDAGGQVISIVGLYEGSTTEYVKDVGYNTHGQMVYIEYGNDTETHYTHDANRGWLSKIETKTTDGSNVKYQNIDYSFDAMGNIVAYTNETDYYTTSQSYEYDDLHQLTKVDGTSTNREYITIDDYTARYSQTYSFDKLGNMVSKASEAEVRPNKIVGDELNYSLDYVYDEDYAYRASSIGKRHYRYDANGNIVLEREGKIEDGEVIGDSHFINDEAENIYSSDYGWALESSDTNEDEEEDQLYERSYTWNDRNLLAQSSDQVTVTYRYGADGQRAIKSTASSETLYFNSLWSWMYNPSAFDNTMASKNIYLGSTRIVTRLNGYGNAGNAGTALENTYYYHADRLGSAQLVTDSKGKKYERTEYTPYGETWIKDAKPENIALLYKFTGNEFDHETALHYYGERFLEPKTSRWLSTNPALGAYIPEAPVNNEVKAQNRNLPGMGGIFNYANFRMYQYAWNNPLKYVDTDTWVAD